MLRRSTETDPAVRALRELRHSGNDRRVVKILDDELAPEERRQLADDARQLWYLAAEPDMSPWKRMLHGATLWRAFLYRRRGTA